MAIRQIWTEDYVVKHGYAHAYLNDPSKLMTPGGGSHLTWGWRGLAR